MDTLPVLLSIPHGGDQVPVELKDRLSIGKEGIIEDSDASTGEIYDLKDKVRFVVKADIARAFIDPSRSASDIPPENPDGVVKSHTCFGKAIYRDGQQPDKEETESLLKKYYRPYHRQIREIIRRNKDSIKLCIDCHSMAETGPALSPDRGQARPLFCLGNRFGESAPYELVHRMKICLVDAFELLDTDVAVNRPFAGGYITRHYGNNPIPWIQVEMNRKLYLKECWFDPETGTTSSARTADLNRRFSKTLTAFFA